MSWVIVTNKDKIVKKRTGLMRNIGLCIITFGLLGLGACSSTKTNKYGVKTSKRVYSSKGSLPKKAGYYKVGKPYKVAGKWYYPREDKTYNKTGLASWYGDEFHGRKTANGEIFDMHAFTGAHKTLPLPSLVKVTNLANGKTIIVRINDRGPYHGGRILDMSRAAADALGYRNKGITKVRVEYVGRASSHPEGDNAKIAALGGKPHGVATSGSNRNFFDHLFGWNKKSFVAENASVNGGVALASVAKPAKSPILSSKLTTGDMQEYDPDIVNAVGGGSLAMARSGAAANSPIIKNQGRLLNLNGNTPVENVGSGEFVQVAMFNEIKQAVEYKKKLGSSVYSKIDIKHNGANTVYLVLVQV